VVADAGIVVPDFVPVVAESRAACGTAVIEIEIGRRGGASRARRRPGISRRDHPRVEGDSMIPVVAVTPPAATGKISVAHPSPANGEVAPKAASARAWVPVGCFALRCVSASEHHRSAASMAPRSRQL
jgi:hypothetical protein